MAGQNRDPFIEQYRRLIGRRVVGIVKSPASRIRRALYGLKFDDHTVAWVMCDPDGNGPGFLEIETNPAAPPDRLIA